MLYWCRRYFWSSMWSCLGLRRCSLLSMISISAETGKETVIMVSRIVWYPSVVCVVSDFFSLFFHFWPHKIIFKRLLHSWTWQRYGSGRIWLLIRLSQFFRIYGSVSQTGRYWETPTSNGAIPNEGSIQINASDGMYEIFASGSRSIYLRERKWKLRQFFYKLVASFSIAPFFVRNNPVFLLKKILQVKNRWEFKRLLNKINRLL